jgi:hypothetical protein
LRVVCVANRASVAGNTGLVASEALASTLGVGCCCCVGRCAKGNCREKEGVEKHGGTERMWLLSKLGL